MRTDTVRSPLVAGPLVAFAAALVAALVIEFRERWMVDALLITAGVAVGSATIIVGNVVGSGHDGGYRLTNAILAVSYVGFIVISAYNAFVLEIMTGWVRGLTMVVVGMTGPAIVIAASRALGNEPLLATD
ncbi:hypothetical protein C440_16784 [Haloferax mucosum ATCC BAA-1512]|uniref:Uncharacterized protein n=1 Tax=Haloferax mucosum ATCC BAA-1512 TaxID=662479 RepID=M0I7M7_9EURY|nr:hypothetical protein [Haloferax mucosum]ELZ91987.1 hypothetical protein C440_16784 [Haloferax mucosum ATCC BAA-1512]